MSGKKSLAEILESRLGFLLNEVLRALRLSLDEALKEVGVSSRHLGLLMVLSHQGPQTQKEMAKALRIDLTTMGLLTSELEKIKLLNRSTHPDDKRCNQVTLTTTGAKAAERGYALAIENQEKFLGVVSKEDWGELRRILTLLYKEHCTEGLDQDFQPMSDDTP